MQTVQYRHETLQHLGVSQWYCKYTLPNVLATPSSFFLKKEEYCEEGEVKAIPLIGAIQGKESAQVAHSLMASLDTMEKGSGKDSSQLFQESVITTKKISPHYLSLAVVRMGALLIFYDIAAAVDNVINLEQTLLLSVVRCLSPAVIDVEAVGNVSSFVWPPFYSPKLLSSQSEYFNGALNSWVGLQSFTGVEKILYIGMNFHYLDDVFLEQRSKNESECAVIPIELTLSELIGSPIKKKKVWSILSKIGAISV